MPELPCRSAIASARPAVCGGLLNAPHRSALTMTSWTPAALAAEMTAIHVLIKSESAGGGQGEWGGSGCGAEFMPVRCILLRDVAVSHRRSLDVR
eukprot:scaffold14634_cov61-Phaeocystis_antarctica.AAC.1